MFYDPPCSCYSCYTRWYDGAGGNSRMVRRARAANLAPVNSSSGGSGGGGGGVSGPSLGTWVNQSVVMGADTLDDSTHGGTQPVDFYGSTAWYSPDGDVYFMAAVRFWHWAPEFGG